MKKFNVFALTLLFLSSISLKAQFDDLYYTESDDDQVTSSIYSSSDMSYDDADFDDAEYEDYGDYEYYSEYDNYYTSRIRRFNRPAGYNFYNSYYGVQDPFYSYYNLTLSLIHI